MVEERRVRDLDGNYALFQNVVVGSDGKEVSLGTFKKYVGKVTKRRHTDMSVDAMSVRGEISKLEAFDLDTITAAFSNSE